MKFIIITLILFAQICFITSCKSIQNTSNSLVILENYSFYKNLHFILWNEDTTNSYTFAQSRDNTFAYTITRKDSIQEYYHGICRITTSRDTIFLIYNKNKKPAFATEYLVREASGKAYIQYLIHGSKKEFLFFQPTYARHPNF